MGNKITWCRLYELFSLDHVHCIFLNGRFLRHPLNLDLYQKALIGCYLPCLQLSLAWLIQFLFLVYQAYLTFLGPIDHGGLHRHVVFNKLHWLSTVFLSFHESTFHPMGQLKVVRVIKVIGSLIGALKLIGLLMGGLKLIGSIKLDLREKFTKRG